MKYLTAEERLKQHGLDAEYRARILNMASMSAEVYITMLPAEEVSEEEMWNRKLDYRDGFVDGMADALALILKNIK